MQVSMMTKRVIFVLVASLVAASSGGGLAIHLYQVDSHHDSHCCDLCIALVSAAPAIAEQPRLVITPLLVCRAVAIFDFPVPVTATGHGPSTSRAPPLV